MRKFSLSSDHEPLFEKENFEDPLVLKNLTRILKIKRGFGFRMPPKNSPVILVVSGGLDSTMLWYLLLKKYHLQVYPLHILISSFSAQKRSVIFFSNFFKKKFPDYYHPPQFIKPHFHFALSNPLSKNKRQNTIIDRPSLIAKNIYTYKKTGYRGIIMHDSTRLAYFLLAAYEHAQGLANQKLSVKTIFIGIVPDDAQTTRESSLTVLRSLNVFFCSMLSDWQWQISAPLEKNSGFFFPKKDLIRIAKKDHFPIEKTFSCNNQLLWSCGICKGCLGRQMAFGQARIKDKSYYLISPFLRKHLKKIYEVVADFFRTNSNQSHGSDQKEILIKFKETNSDFYQFIVSLPKTIKIDFENKSGYVLNSETGLLTKINQTGYFILILLQNKGPITIYQLLKELTKQYQGVEKTRLSHDLYLFLKKMFKEGFVFINKGS